MLDNKDWSRMMQAQALKENQAFLSHIICLLANQSSASSAANLLPVTCT